jgi:hypothetical protein
MKFFRFFAVFAIVVSLLITFNTYSQAQDNQQNNTNNCIVHNFKKGQRQDVFPSLPSNLVLQQKITHTAVITVNQDDFSYQQKAFENAGFNSWTPVNTVNSSATYCGKPVQLKADILLSQDYLTAPGYFEIFYVYGDEPTFFSDYYNIHGPSLLYTGLEALPGVTYEQVQNFLQQQNIPIVFHSEALGAIVDFIRIGYAYFEIVTPISTTN